MIYFRQGVKARSQVVGVIEITLKFDRVERNFLAHKLRIFRYGGRGLVRFVPSREPGTRIYIGTGRQDRPENNFRFLYSSRSA
jgi:hypothetical protein